MILRDSNLTRHELTGQTAIVTGGGRSKSSQGPWAERGAFLQWPTMDEDFLVSHGVHYRQVSQFGKFDWPGTLLLRVRPRHL